MEDDPLIPDGDDYGDNSDWIKVAGERMEPPSDGEIALQSIMGEVTQEQTAREKKIFALLHPSDGHHTMPRTVGHPIGHTNEHLVKDLMRTLGISTRAQVTPGLSHLPPRSPSESTLAKARANPNPFANRKVRGNTLARKNARIQAKMDRLLGKAPAAPEPASSHQLRPGSTVHALMHGRVLDLRMLTGNASGTNESYTGVVEHIQPPSGPPIRVNAFIKPVFGNELSEGDRMARNNLSAAYIAGIMGNVNTPPVVTRDVSIKKHWSSEPETKFCTVAPAIPDVITAVENGFSAQHKPYVEYLRDKLSDIALFDAVIDNHDRNDSNFLLQLGNKPDHFLKREVVKVWAIDHDLTFNAPDPQNPTFHVDIVGQLFQGELLQDRHVQALQNVMDARPEVTDALIQYGIEPIEVRTMFDRVEHMLNIRKFPQPNQPIMRPAGK